MLKRQLIENIETERIGFSTLYKLLSSMEDEDNSQIKNILLEVLYLCKHESLKKALLQSGGEILQLEEHGDDIRLFDIGYKITKKSVKGEKNN